MAATVVGFEGIVPSNSFGDVPNGYAGLDWGGFTAVGKQYMHHFDFTKGYQAPLHGRAIAYISGDGADRFSSSDGTFTVRSVILASAFNNNEHVVFHAYADGVQVGHKAIVVDQKAVTIQFGAAFHHIDEVRITAHGGSDADPDDGGGPGEHLSFDNFRIAFDPAPDAVDTAPSFAQPHVSDWPLA